MQKYFGILRNADLHFLAGTKEMIDSVAAGKYYCCISRDFNFLLLDLAEIPSTRING